MPNPGPRPDSRASPVASSHRRRHRVVVVLDEEADRQLPRRREVEGLQRGSDVDRAVAEVGDRDGVGARMPVCPGVARGQRHTAADDRVGADRAGLVPLQVHRAAAAAAEPAGQPADLGQRAQQHGADVVGQIVARVDALGCDVVERLGQELVVPAVGSVDRIRTRQRQHRADRAGLLPDAGVRRAVDEALACQLEHVLLEGADQRQVAEHVGQQLGGRGVPVLGRRRDLDPRGGGFEVGVSAHQVLRSVSRRPQLKPRLDPIQDLLSDKLRILIP